MASRCLRNLSKANPAVAEIHRALGEAYAGHGEYQQAADELRAAIQLNEVTKRQRTSWRWRWSILKRRRGVQP